MASKSISPQASPPLHLTKGLVILASLALTLTLYALVAFRKADPGLPAFGAFYESGRAWWRGDFLYPMTKGGPNMNPPLATAAFFGPLALLPLGVAQFVWTAAGLLALAGSVSLIVRELRLSATSTVWLVAALSVTYGSFYVWAHGQVTWLLLYPVTRSWVEFRHGRSVRAGMWLASAIAIKPNLAFAALLLPPPLWVVAGLASLGLTLVGIWWTGWAAWQAWLKTLGSVAWLAYPANASLWGVASRLQTGTELGGSVADLHAAWTVAIVACGVAAAWVTVREDSADRRMGAALVFALLVSPLGWVYYSPFVLGPVTSTWSSANRMLWLALACLCVPVPLLVTAWQHSPLLIRTLGNVYTAGLLALWIAWTLIVPRRAVAAAAAREA